RTAQVDDSGLGVGDHGPVVAMSSLPVWRFQPTSAMVACPERSEGTPPLQRESSAGSESLFPRRVSHACLLHGARLEVEILRSRLEQLPAKPTRTSFKVSAA